MSFHPLEEVGSPAGPALGQPVAGAGAEAGNACEPVNTAELLTLLDDRWDRPCHCRIGSMARSDSRSDVDQLPAGTEVASDGVSESDMYNDVYVQ